MIESRTHRSITLLATTFVALMFVFALFFWGEAKEVLAESEQTAGQSVVKFAEQHRFISVTEGVEGIAELAVVLEPASNEAVTVDYVVTADDVTDFATAFPMSGTIEFSPGEVLEVIGFIIGDDPRAEPNEMITVTLSNPTNASLEDPVGTVTIIDDDSGPPPVVQFASAVISVAEGAGSVLVEVVLDKPAELPALVFYETVSGSASEDDYTPIKSSLIYTVGDTSQLFFVGIKDDTLHEQTEAFSITMEVPVGGVLGDNDVLTINILDDDPPSPGPVVGFATSVITVTEDVGVVNATVQISPTNDQKVTVSGVSMSGSAIEVEDFQPYSLTLEFPPGETFRNVAMQIHDDDQVEGTEYYTIVLTNAIGAELGTSVVEVRIVDNDFIPSIGFRDSVITATEGMTEALELYVDINPLSNHPTMFEIEVLSGTAVVGQDFTIPITAATIQAFESSVRVSLVISDDQEVETVERITLAITNVQNALAVTDTMVIAVNDNDNATSDLPAVSFHAESSPVNENSGTATVRVNLVPTSTEVVTVNFVVEAGTAQLGSDYAVISDTIIFQPGDSVEHAEVQIVQDAIAEEEESFFVVISSVSGAVLGPNLRAEVPITDDDSSIRPWLYLPHINTD